MELNKYLLLKQATRLVSAPALDANLGRYTQDQINNVGNTVSLYDKMTAGNKDLYSDIPVAPSTKNSFRPRTFVEASSEGMDPDIASYIILKPNGHSIYSLLHEKGHSLNNAAGKYPLSGKINKGRFNSLSNILGFKKSKLGIYGTNYLKDTLDDERAAWDYARNVINTIQDENVRNQAMQQLNAEANSAYGTYDSVYGRLLRADRTGGLIGGALGGAGLGYVGYKGGDALAKWLKWKNNGLGHNLLRYGGMLAGGAGGWLGGRLLGGMGGQAYTSHAYKNQMKNDLVNLNKQNENAINNNMANLQFLYDYYK